MPGGKGIGGRWLFVSHAPLEKNGGYTARDFGLREPRKGSLASTDPHRLRVARFQFEPMVRESTAKVAGARSKFVAVKAECAM